MESGRTSRLQNRGEPRRILRPEQERAYHQNAAELETPRPVKRFPIAVACPETPRGFSNVVSFDVDRETFVRNLEAALSRSERRAQELDQLLADWKRDLEGWTRPFRERLLARYRHAAELSMERRHTVIGWVRRMRVHPTAELYLDALVPAYMELWAAIEQRREARTGSQSARKVAAANMERAQIVLLEVLWCFGRRRVDRAELEPLARSRLALQRELLEHELASRRRREEQIRTRLEAGVYLRGRRAGEPLSNFYRGQLDRELADRTQMRVKVETKLAACADEPDLLAALGLRARTPHGGSTAKRLDDKPGDMRSRHTNEPPAGGALA